jgi:NIMA-interacting peptidyl-prolyl cis-trans isomerase 4
MGKKGEAKAADKSSGGKSGGKKNGKGDGDEKDGKVKGAQSINVRHILVRLFGPQRLQILAPIWRGI